MRDLLSRPLLWLLALIVVGLLMAWNLESAASVVSIVAIAAFAVIASTIDYSRLRIKAPGVEAEVERKEKKLQDAVTKAAEVTAPDQVVEVPTIDSKALSHTADAVIVRADYEQKRRDALQRLIQEAAEWGYGMAQIGFTSPPEPLLEWSEAGEPRILYGRGRSS